MIATFRTLSAACLLLLVTTPLHAQNEVNPSGRWEGSISAPFGEIPIALDIWRTEAGELAATYSRGDGAVTGFPLSDIELHGNDLKLALKANGGGIFHGSVANTTLSGTFAAFAGTAPFVVTRRGDPHVTTAPVNAAISKTLEGTWTARLAAGNDSATFTMRLANTGTGTATGIIADDHGVEVPLKIAQNDARVAITIPAAGSSFAGTLNPAGTEIVGSYSEGDLHVPLTFARVP